MKFNTDEIASLLREEIDRYESGIDVREVGRVLEVGDGIARVWGLSGVMAGEMVEFPGGITGLAFNLHLRKLLLRLLHIVLHCLSLFHQPGQAALHHEVSPLCDRFDG